MKLTATIVALNEQRNIARALESLHCADEVIVIDSGSTDRTRDIARSLGARLIEEPWRGYAAQKNFAAECAAHDWILSIDADESLSEVLQAEILELKREEPHFDGYAMPRLAQYCGRWIKHSGWYPDRKTRLYHRAKAKWVGDFVHESVRVDGTVGQLEGRLLHFTCNSVEEHRKTLDRYTTLAARELIAKRAPTPIWKLALDPAWTFVKSYLVQQGFRDGPQGFTIARMASRYTFLKYSKARELARDQETA
jgi:glycosyltransferase involved in cell wall biosynthesis